MAEMTIKQIIKIAIFLLVVIVVIYGAYVGFREYIIPYFQGISPAVEIEPGEEIAGVGVREEVVGYIVIGRWPYRTQYFKPAGEETSHFYFTDLKDGKVKISKPWRIDTTIGKVENRKIIIESEYIKKYGLEILTDTVIVGDRVLKIK